MRKDMKPTEGAGVVRKDLEALLETLRSVKGGCEDGLSAIDLRASQEADRMMRPWPMRAMPLDETGLQKIRAADDLLGEDVRRHLKGTIGLIEKAEESLAHVLAVLLVQHGRCEGLVELALRNVRGEEQEKEKA